MPDLLFGGDLPLRFQKLDDRFPRLVDGKSFDRFDSGSFDPSLSAEDDALIEPVGLYPMDIGLISVRAAHDHS